MTLVPAGFDIARLQNYRDEKNHWHRKKSTRYDHVPHDQSSCEELLSNAHDQSSSSSDFFQIKPPAPKQKHAATTLAKRFTRPSVSRENDKGSIFSEAAEQERPILDLSVPSISGSSVVKPFKCSQYVDSEAYHRASSKDTCNNSGFDGALPSQIST